MSPWLGRRRGYVVRRTRCWESSGSSSETSGRRSTENQSSLCSGQSKIHIFRGIYFPLKISFFQNFLLFFFIPPSKVQFTSFIYLCCIISNHELTYPSGFKRAQIITINEKLLLLYSKFRDDLWHEISVELKFFFFFRMFKILTKTQVFCSLKRT